MKVVKTVCGTDPISGVYVFSTGYISVTENQPVLQLSIHLLNGLQTILFFRLFVCLFVCLFVWFFA